MSDLLTSLSEHHEAAAPHEEHAAHETLEHLDGEHAHHGGHHSDQPLIILFIFVGLLIGGALRY